MNRDIKSAPDTASIDPEQLVDVSLDEALAMAVNLHRSGNAELAESLYRRVLQADPASPDALHFLGVLLHQRDRSDEAVELIERSIALDPGQPDRYNNLGNVLLERGEFERAADVYGQAITLQPGHADAHNNLGVLLRALQRGDEAEQAYRRAIALNPEHVDAYNNLGMLLAARGATHDAVACYCKAITLKPLNAQSRKLLGVAYYTIGEIDKAGEVFRQWLADEPDHPIARHMLAACSGLDVPPRAADAYVAATFDAFADSFDAKLERLNYRAPSLLVETLGRLAAADETLIVLDAGCGTGLCGSLLKPYAARLLGVDLSAGMLTRAAARHVYDKLYKGELTAFLAAHDAAFDIIVSADTLVYFGQLDGVARAASHALRPGGLLLFTVEACDASVAAGYRINPHGRYSHGGPYVADQLRAAGFELLQMAPAVLRSEAGEDVHGLVVAARKP